MLRVRRVIRTESRPVAYLVDYLPEGILGEEGLAPTFRGSLLDHLLARGESLTTARANISAIGAPTEVAKALELQRGDVLLHFNSQVFNEAGKVITFSFSYFIPGYFNFHVVRRVAVPA
jgi:GntR family transcriptional regulator